MAGQSFLEVTVLLDGEDHMGGTALCVFQNVVRHSSSSVDDALDPAQQNLSQER